MPRSDKPEYKENCTRRERQGGPAKPQKAVTILVGPSRPPVASAAAIHDKEWSSSWKPTRNEEKMRGRGNSRRT